jgi:adenylosuccinate synthase
MAVVVIIGAQWGDEGKGKVVDLYTEHADLVVRYGGGANAGHTLVVDGQKLVTHLVPSGVLHAGKVNVLGSGMVVDPAVLLEEIGECHSRGLLSQTNELVVSDLAHVILGFHKDLDGLREAAAGGAAIGTTRRGIGPAYEAKVGRRGVRIGDLLRPSRLTEVLRRALDEANPLLVRLGGQAYDLEKLTAEAAALGEKLRPWIGDSGKSVHAAISKGQSVLFEGAQGTLLDVDHGTYPYVTSSSTIAGGACTGVGVGPTEIDAVVGISKAYCTRVGAGPFPTELTGPEGDRLRESGAEYGATTGRPRRVGWLDVPALRLAVRLNGLAGLALTKLDVLSGVRPLPICVGYRLDGELLDELPGDADDVARAEPVYEMHEGWTEDVKGTRDLDDLPANARRYLRRIEDLLGIPLFLVSVGPGRAETIVLKNPFR